MRELWLQMWHDIHPDAKSKFMTKGTLSYFSPFFSVRILAVKRNYICEQLSAVHLGMLTAIGIMLKLDVLGQNIVNTGYFENPLFILYNF